MTRPAPAFLAIVLVVLAGAACNGDLVFLNAHPSEVGGFADAGLDDTGHDDGGPPNEAGAPAVCASDRDCVPPSPWCDVAVGPCIPCASAARCTCDLITRRCVRTCPDNAVFHAPDCARDAPPCSGVAHPCAAVH